MSSSPFYKTRPAKEETVDMLMAYGDKKHPNRHKPKRGTFTSPSKQEESRISTRHAGLHVVTSPTRDSKSRLDTIGEGAAPAPAKSPAQLREAVAESRNPVQRSMSINRGIERARTDVGFLNAKKERSDSIEEVVTKRSSVHMGQSRQSSRSPEPIRLSPFTNPSKRDLGDKDFEVSLQDSFLRPNIEPLAASLKRLPVLARLQEEASGISSGEEADDEYLSPSRPRNLIPVMKDVTYKTDRLGHGLNDPKVAQKSFIDFAVPNSKIPSGDKIYNKSPTLPPNDPFAEFDVARGYYIKQVFPAKRPSGRYDVVLLDAWLTKAMDKISRRAKKKRISCPEKNVMCLKNSLEAYGIALNEVVRQVSVHCVERGQVLYKIYCGLLQNSKLLTEALIYDYKAIADKAQMDVKNSKMTMLVMAAVNGINTEGAAGMLKESELREFEKMKAKAISLMEQIDNRDKKSPQQIKEERIAKHAALIEDCLAEIQETHETMDAFPIADLPPISDVFASPSATDVDNSHVKSKSSKKTRLGSDSDASDRVVKKMKSKRKGRRRGRKSILRLNDGGYRSEGGTWYNPDGSKREGTASEGGRFHTPRGGYVSEGGTYYDKDGKVQNDLSAKARRHQTPLGGYTSDGGTKYNEDGTKRNVGKCCSGCGRLVSDSEESDMTWFSESDGNGGRVRRRRHRDGYKSDGGTWHTPRGGWISEGGTRYDKHGNVNNQNDSDYDSDRTSADYVSTTSEDEEGNGKRRIRPRRDSEYTTPSSGLEDSSSSNYPSDSSVWTLDSNGGKVKRHRRHPNLFDERNIRKKKKRDRKKKFISRRKRRAKYQMDTGKVAPPADNVQAKAEGRRVSVLSAAGTLAPRGSIAAMSEPGVPGNMQMVSGQYDYSGMSYDALVQRAKELEVYNDMYVSRIKRLEREKEEMQAGRGSDESNSEKEREDKERLQRIAGEKKVDQMVQKHQKEQKKMLDAIQELEQEYSQMEEEYRSVKGRSNFLEVQHMDDQAIIKALQKELAVLKGEAPSELDYVDFKQTQTDEETFNDYVKELAAKLGMETKPEEVKEKPKTVEKKKDRSAMTEQELWEEKIRKLKMNKKLRESLLAPVDKKSRDKCKPLGWVLKSIAQVYMSKIENDAVNDKTGTARLQMWEWCYDFHMMKYGLKNIAETNLIDFFVAIRVHTKNERVQMFRAFVFNDIPLEGLNFMLSVLQKYQGKSKALFTEGPGEIALTNAKNAVSGSASEIGEANALKLIEKLVEIAEGQPKKVDLDSFISNLMKAWILEYKRIDENNRAIFRAGDIDGDGELTFEEFREIVSKIDQSINEQEVANMYRQATDMNADGVILVENFVVMARKFGLGRAWRRELGMQGDMPEPSWALLDQTWMETKDEIEQKMEEIKEYKSKNAVDIETRLRNFEAMIKPEERTKANLKAEDAWIAYRNIVKELHKSKNAGMGWNKIKTEFSPSGGPATSGLMDKIKGLLKRNSIADFEEQDLDSVELEC